MKVRPAKFLLHLKGRFCKCVLFCLLPVLSIIAEDRYVDANGDWRGNGRSGSPFQNVIEGVLDITAGSTLHIRTGHYAEKMLVRKAIHLRAEGGSVTIGKGEAPGFITCDGGPMQIDDDGDGIDDRCEEALAQKYAPIIFHSSDESNFPTSVDWFLQKTSLRFFDDDCFPDLNELIVAKPTQEQLLNRGYSGNCGSQDTVFSGGTRSKEKERTFLLEDVADQFRGGSSDTRDWITYVHAYPNKQGGVTLQYWRFYAYNDAALDHGGDWEGIHVALDAALNPVQVSFLGHVGIERVNVNDVEWEGSHPRVYSEGGGHASHPHQRYCSHIPGTHIVIDCDTPIQARDCIGLPAALDTTNPCTFTRQETWAGGVVRRHSGETSLGGGLLNVGAKIAPLNNQYFIQYSGLWGSRGFSVPSSGYWGPAYNETEMGADGFIRAWGDETLSTKITKEWYPVLTSR